MTNSLNQRASRLRVPRRGVTMTRPVLIVLVVGLVLLALGPLCGRNAQSPLRLAGLAPGMSESAMRKVVSRDSHGSVKCRPFSGAFQLCNATLNTVGGEVSVLLGPRGRVAAVQIHQTTGESALQTTAEQVRPQWDQAARSASAPPQVDKGDTGVTRWVTSDRRWSAEMHYRGEFEPDVPMMMMVADEHAIARLVAQSPHDAEMAKHFQYVDPSPDEAASAFEERQSDRATAWSDTRLALVMLHDQQVAYHSAHGTYASQLQQLDGMFVPGAARVEIITATDSGWSAYATHPQFPGRSCATYMGRVNIPSTWLGVPITTADGVACDSIPTMPRPSLGSGG